MIVRNSVLNRTIFKGAYYHKISSGANGYISPAFSKSSTLGACVSKAQEKVPTERQWSRWQIDWWPRGVAARRPPMTIFYGKTVRARVAFCLSRESVGVLAADCGDADELVGSVLEDIIQQSAERAS
jgi:hypothetical protein